MSFKTLILLKNKEKLAKRKILPQNREVEPKSQKK